MTRATRPAANRNVSCVTLAAIALLTVFALSWSPPAGAEEPSAAAPGKEATDRVAAAGKPDNAIDRLHLDSTSITGNRELPKVMSIVPWKAAEPPAGPDRPMGSLIEEVLSPVDRDEFRREITYYGDLTSQSSAEGAVAGTPAASIEPVRTESTPSSPPGASIP